MSLAIVIIWLVVCLLVLGGLLAEGMFIIARARRDDPRD